MKTAVVRWLEFGEIDLTRYPASLGSLPEGMPDVEDAEGFYEFARSVLAQVKKALQAG
jgi:hypothetical protein